MDRSLIIGSFGFLAAALCTMFSGCNNSGAPVAAIGGNHPAGPKETVGEFLEAWREGDAGTVNRLLTSIARKKTAELEISVAPPGSETARFELGQFRFLSEAKKTAHVQSKLMEVDETGQEQAHEITWILRHEPAGWRVMGMMGEFVPDNGVMVFNFEKPGEVIRQRESSEQLIKQRQVREPE